jgi:hypothetical protein
MKYNVGIAAGGTIYVSGFTKIYLGIQVILQLFPKQFESRAMLVSRSRVLVSLCDFI